MLDIGFGGGVGIARLLQQRVGLAADLEISEAMLHRGRRRFRREITAGTVELTTASVAAIPYADGSFDLVYSVNTIYFWPDPAAGVREILRVLRPGGRLVLGTETAEAMSKRSFTRHGFTLFTEPQLEQLLRDGGLDQISCKRLGDSVLTTGHKAPSRWS